MSDTNWEIKGVKAHYFLGPLCRDGQFRTLANLLREVADWIAANGIEDSELENLKVTSAFSDKDEGGDLYLSATLYYREKE